MTIAKWLHYHVQASNAKGHGIHSPFVYDLIHEVFNDQSIYYSYQAIESLKKELILEERVIEVVDLGAGGYGTNKLQRKIADIAKNSLSEQKFGRLLFRLVNHYDFKKIIELGTSLGISAAYLASANRHAKVITLEGSREVAAVAELTFQKLNLENIVQVIGNFEDNLKDAFELNIDPDLIFIDGNHRKKPVLEYFEFFIGRVSSPSMIIIHDIHWSREMEEAWLIIRKDPRVKMSIDIFSAGLIFIREEFQVKQSFTIRF